MKKMDDDDIKEGWGTVDGHGWEAHVKKELQWKTNMQRSCGAKKHSP